MKKQRKSPINFLSSLCNSCVGQRYPLGHRNLIPILILGIIIFLSFFLRFYRLRDYIIFLGDQGRDVWVVSKMVLEGKFTLLGPVASVGGFYLGPIYYYFITPFLILSSFDPIGPAIFIATLGVLTTAVIFFFVRKYFDLKTAIVSSFLYATSPVLIQLNRFSWNPNAVPFFSIVFYIFFFIGLIKIKRKHIFFAGVMLGVLFQLHYLAFLFLPTAFIVIFIEQKNKLKKAAESTLFLLFGIALGWLPFIFYELRHSFQNFYGLFSFMTRNDANTVGLDFSRIISSIRIDSALIISNLFHVPSIINSLLRIVVAIYIAANIFSKNNARRILSLFVFSVFGGLIFYKGRMEIHYLNIIYVFVLIIIADSLITLGKIHLSIPIVVVLVLLYFSSQAYFFRETPNKQLDQTIDISKFIMSKIGKEKFNFALITKSNGDHAYRYFFDLWGNESVEIKPDDPASVTKTLIVLCEPLTRSCDPRGNSLWEIAGFGRAEIVKQWERGVYKVYKMEHVKK
jgi:4-amino-4-deoxy-L-arabinose transferase-like glycosyltransferase